MAPPCGSICKYWSAVATAWLDAAFCQYSNSSSLHGFCSFNSFAPSALSPQLSGHTCTPFILIFNQNQTTAVPKHWLDFYKSCTFSSPPLQVCVRWSGTWPLHGKVGCSHPEPWSGDREVVQPSLSGVCRLHHRAAQSSGGGAETEGTGWHGFHCSVLKCFSLSCLMAFFSQSQVTETNRCLQVDGKQVSLMLCSRCSDLMIPEESVWNDSVSVVSPPQKISITEAPISSRLRRP